MFPSFMIQHGDDHRHRITKPSQKKHKIPTTRSTASRSHQRTPGSSHSCLEALPRSRIARRAAGRLGIGFNARTPYRYSPHSTVHRYLHLFPITTPFSNPTVLAPGEGSFLCIQLPTAQPCTPNQHLTLNSKPKPYTRRPKTLRERFPFSRHLLP